MDIQYAMKLAKVYEKLHNLILTASANFAEDWPVCIDPRDRRREFVDFMVSLEDSNNDEWAAYYLKIGSHVEALLDIRPPKDTTI